MWVHALSSRVGQTWVSKRWSTGIGVRLFEGAKPHQRQRGCCGAHTHTAYTQWFTVTTRSWWIHTRLHEIGALLALHLRVVQAIEPLHDHTHLRHSMFFCHHFILLAYFMLALSSVGLCFCYAVLLLTFSSIADTK